MQFPQQVRMVEVGPRDGLQNEAQIITSADKVKFIQALVACGLKTVEVTSFVSPKWVPQLADAKDVWQQLPKLAGVDYPVLVPNKQGLDTALALGVKEIAVFTTASEAFSQKNTHCSVSESLARIADLIPHAKTAGVKIRAYLSCVLGCPYEGEMAATKVAKLANELWQMGCYEISLGDTIGVGTPFKTLHLLDNVAAVVPVKNLAVHMHDTYGQALANILTALSQGVAVVDSSVAGLGGCPYAKGATGNVATEDVVYMLQGMGIETGIDLPQLVQVGQAICQQLNRPVQSKVNRALTAKMSA